MKNIDPNTSSARLALCALVVLGLAFASVAPAASTTLPATEEAAQDGTPCVIITTDPPGATLASDCASGALVMLDGEPIP